MKRIILLASIVAMAFVGISAQTDATRATRVTAEDEYYIFQLNNEVTRTHVYYDTRFGIEIAGDLYVAKNIDKSKKHPAIVIGPPYGGVKEQGPGVYANELARRDSSCSPTTLPIMDIAVVCRALPLLRNSMPRTSAQESITWVA